MIDRKVNTALRLPSEIESPRILKKNNETIDLLKYKHPGCAIKFEDLSSNRNCGSDVSLEALFACKRIPSDKKPGVRPIIIGGEIRRITGHAVMIIFRRNFLEGAGDLQLCQGQRSSGEIVMYALSLIFNEENCDAV